jgi:hypothetical protein
MSIGLLRVLIVIAISFGHASLWAASKAELWARWQKHDPANRKTIDHYAWDRFLKQYIVAPHPSGINRLRYQAVTPEDLKSLKNYLQEMQSVAISNYSRAEQKAYWINLYNAAIVDLVVARFPLKSIRDINISPGLLARGPWGAKLFSVEGERLSLDDIEHRILRPIWKDNRVHYALNWASLGCPHLQPAAFTAENAETLLDRGALDFVNHPRGVTIQKGRLQVSSLYVWFQEDFGGDAEELMEHWQKYANPPLVDALEKYSGGLAHDYDWRLNGVEEKP